MQTRTRACAREHTHQVISVADPSPGAGAANLANPAAAAACSAPPAAATADLAFPFAAPTDSFPDASTAAFYQEIPQNL